MKLFYLTTHSTHFYLQLYGIGHTVMVKDPSASEWMFVVVVLFVVVVVDRHVLYWLEREIAQWIHHEGSIRRSIAP